MLLQRRKSSNVLDVLRPFLLSTDLQTSIDNFENITIYDIKRDKELVRKVIGTLSTRLQMGSNFQN